MLGKLLAKSKLVVEWGLSTKDKLGLLFNKQSVKTIIHHNKPKKKKKSDWVLPFRYQKSCGFDPLCLVFHHWRRNWYAFTSLSPTTKQTKRKFWSSSDPTPTNYRAGNQRPKKLGDNTQIRPSPHAQGSLVLSMLAIQDCSCPTRQSPRRGGHGSSVDVTCHQATQFYSSQAIWHSGDDPEQLTLTSV